MLTRADEITTAGNRPSAFGKVSIGGTKDGKISGSLGDGLGSGKDRVVPRGVIPGPRMLEK